jgi:hypothetical protein
MSASRLHCRCGKVRVARFDTDGHGGLVDITPACVCATAAPKKKRAWALKVDAERRRACICQRCDQPTVGKPRVSLYCLTHHTEVRREIELRHKEKVGQKHVRNFRARHRARLLRKARAYHRKHRAQMLDYKREWRKKNRDKVRQQKRRSALRGRTAEAQRRRRADIAAGFRAAEPQQPARRNESGERLCLTSSCNAVVRSRAKLCPACRACSELQEAA